MPRFFKNRIKKSPKPLVLPVSAAVLIEKGSSAAAFPIKKIRAAWRLFLLAFFTIWKTMEALLPTFWRGYDLDHAMRTRRDWARKMLRWIGLRIEIRGEPPAFACIVVANHRSYLDPILILRDTLAFPISKAEVRKWPVLGAGAAATGVIFLARDSARSRAETLLKISETVKNGHSVILFPEGTTSETAGTLPFKPGVFQLAAKHGLAIVPVALTFHDRRDFWGEESFAAHFFRTFGEKRKKITVSYGPALRGLSAEELLAASQKWINENLEN